MNENKKIVDVAVELEIAAKHFSQLPGAAVAMLSNEIEANRRALLPASAADDMEGTDHE